MLPNTPPMVECHFGIPMLGAVLCSLNTRLDASAIAFMLEHGEAKAVIIDREFSVVMSAALKMLSEKGHRLPLVIDADDSQYSGPGKRIGTIEYDDFVAQGSPEYEWQLPPDEWDSICLNYTSGTTGNPKGWSIRIVALMSMPSQIFLSGICPSIRLISGPYPCFIAMAGAFPGRLQPGLELMSA